MLLNLFPRLLKRAIGFGLNIPIRVLYARCSKHLRPLLEELTHTKSASITESSSSAPLFSSWLVSNSEKFPSDSPERTLDFLRRRIMVLNFVAIHTSTLTMSNLLLDVFSNASNDKTDLVKDLRDEYIASSNH